MKTIVVCPIPELYESSPKGEYRILQVTDSLKYTPGKVIVKRELNELCLAKTWKVTVKAK